MELIQMRRFLLINEIVRFLDFMKAVFLTLVLFNLIL